MEILKKGNLERKWKYTCEICGCEFVLDANDRATSPLRLCSCPTCGNLIDKDKGELYEQLPSSMFKEEDIDRFIKEKVIYQIVAKENKNV